MKPFTVKRGVPVWTVFLRKGPGPERQVPCEKGGRVSIFDHHSHDYMYTGTPPPMDPWTLVLLPFGMVNQESRDLNSRNFQLCPQNLRHDVTMLPAELLSPWPGLAPSPALLGPRGKPSLPKSPRQLGGVVSQSSQHHPIIFHPQCINRGVPGFSGDSSPFTKLGLIHMGST